MRPERSEEIDRIISEIPSVQAASERAAVRSALVTANQFIKDNPSLKGMLDELIAIRDDYIEITRLLNRWHMIAAVGNQDARDALVLTGGFMYEDLQRAVPSGKVRGFIAAQACSALLSLDDPKREGQDRTTYGRDAFLHVILPVVSSGNTLGKEGLDVFSEATRRYSFSAHPYYSMNGRVGFRERVADIVGAVTHAFERAALHIPGFKPKGF